MSRIVALYLALAATGVMPALAHALGGAEDNCDDDEREIAAQPRQEHPEPPDGDEGEERGPCSDCSEDACGICLFCPARVVPAVDTCRMPVAQASLSVALPVLMPSPSVEREGIFHPPRA